MPRRFSHKSVAGGFALLFALSLLTVAAVTPASATTSYSASLGVHGAARLTVGQSVYVNLKAMAPGTWKQQLWAGTCASPLIRLAVLPNLVVPKTRVLKKTTQTAVVSMTDYGLVLRLLHGSTVVCGAFVKPLLEVVGHTSETTHTFSAPADWFISWAYNCSLAGTPPFTITVYVNGEPISGGVNDLDASGSGVEQVSGEPGQAYLSINSECGWSVDVFGGHSGAPMSSATPAPTSTPITSPDLLNVSGNGIQDTESFTAPAEWQVEWTYNCSNFGSAGNFAIYVYVNGEPVDNVSTSGMSGSSVEYEHNAAGQAYLSINSECDWTVQATAASAAQATPPPSGDLLDVSGNGIETTNTFTTPAAWEIDWSYDCTSYGSAGNFAVDIYVNGNPIPDDINELNVSGSGIEDVTNGAGQTYLSINSECDWTVTAKSDE